MNSRIGFIGALLGAGSLYIAGKAIYDRLAINRMHNWLENSIYDVEAMPSETVMRFDLLKLCVKGELKLPGSLINSYMDEIQPYLLETLL